MFIQYPKYFFSQARKLKPIETEENYACTCINKKLIKK